MGRITGLGRKAGTMVFKEGPICWIANYNRRRIPEAILRNIVLHSRAMGHSVRERTKSLGRGQGFFDKVLPWTETIRAAKLNCTSRFLKISGEDCFDLTRQFARMLRETSPFNAYAHLYEFKTFSIMYLHIDALSVLRLPQVVIFDRANAEKDVLAVLQQVYGSASVSCVQNVSTRLFTRQELASQEWRTAFHRQR